MTDQHHWRYRHERNLGRDDTQEQSLVHQRLSARRTRCISTGTLKGFCDMVERAKLERLAPPRPPLRVR